MNKVDAIKPNHSYTEPMMVTWDTGKKCNYDCSYCEASRHDNYSRFHSLQEYLDTFDFIRKYVKLHDEYKNFKPEEVNINFTGGEPTLNPNFWSLADNIKEHNPEYRLSLTTNGAWNPRYTDKIKQRFSGVTVSYHAESNQNLKKMVLDNILSLKDTGIWLQVNVMLHQDYFSECVEVYKTLKENNIKANPRPIGDGTVSNKGWFKDDDGVLRRTTHEYTESQKDWFFNEIGAKPNKSCSSGDEFGRGCCGGRCLQGLKDGEWVDINFVDTHFKGWYCSVNWYFLHIEQHTGFVFTHQTCQAKLNNEKGPIGTLKNTDKIIEQAKNNIKNNAVITCPNDRCGCGMCAPKAASQEVFENLKKII